MLKFIRVLNRELDGTIARNRVIIGQQEKIVSTAASGSRLPPDTPGPAGAPLPAVVSGPTAPRGSGGGGAASASGGSSAGATGAGRIQGAQLIRARGDASNARTVDYLNQHCERVKIRRPRPGNLFAVQQNDMVEVDGWRCPDLSEYEDPASVQSFLGPARRSQSSGGNYGGGTAPSRPDVVRNANTPTGQVGYGGNTPVNEGGRVSAAGSASSSSAGGKRVSPDGEAIVKAISEGNRALIDEIKRRPTGIESRARGRDF